MKPMVSEDSAMMAINALNRENKVLIERLKLADAVCMLIERGLFEWAEPNDMDWHDIKAALIKWHKATE